MAGTGTGDPGESSSALEERRRRIGLYRRTLADYDQDRREFSAWFHNRENWPSQSNSNPNYRLHIPLCEPMLQHVLEDEDVVLLYDKLRHLQKAILSLGLDASDHSFESPLRLEILRELQACRSLRNRIVDRDHASMHRFPVVEIPEALTQWADKEFEWIIKRQELKLERIRVAARQKAEEASASYQEMRTSKETRKRAGKEEQFNAQKEAIAQGIKYRRRITQ